ncbi:Neutral ceramidase 2 [Penicillium cataractarum]|uniref:Neutral ceramidase n=1 Tax=Penicillium cataractarum TaxID=2100454 RepID=A0A9W9V1H9_9EURO|nr:Neutral ceramidase 2 [Penicillium cataractarum]KAJ5364284.1 Neutral ceramidase 2 [Penicillium cataractarum]
MANLRLGAAFGAVTVTLLVFMQLVAVMRHTDQVPSSSFNRNLNQWRNRAGAATDDGLFLVGAGKADVTGPVVEVDFNGYASLDQLGTGLRQRIYSRAFIFADPNNPDDTFIYLVLDTLAGDTAVRHGVLQGLAALGGDYARYGEHNVALTGTHSHSGPGAWMNYLLPQIPTKGFDKQSYQAIVDGTILSIKRAHESLTPGRLSFGSIDLEDANINRSPYSYDHNPEEEKAKYSAKVDKTLTLLRFDRESDNKTTAVLTWFPVHGTSMYNNNTIVTGDNKGVAAYLFERSVENDSQFADGAVIGFSQSNVGDTSPNVEGAWCEDGSNVMCTYADSTCGGSSGSSGTNEACHGRGPFFREKDNGAKSCFEIGKRQYTAAKTLYGQLSSGSTGTALAGSSDVRSFHVYQDMNGYTFPSPFNGTTLKTCPAALGYSFAAGTTDGPGAFDFTQNATGPATENPLWKVARAFIHQPTEEQQECQGAKDILLDVGTLTEPYAWAADIVDIQVLRVGQLFIIVSTSEATTMSGRRWKAAIAQAAQDTLCVSSPQVVLGAPSNSYAHYVATEEEYNVQRYEGASTLYGPSTLAAYINLTLTYLPYLGSASDIAKLPTIPTGPSPPINTNNSLSFITGVVYDNPPIGKSYGDVVSNPAEQTYGPGDLVNTTFVGANPRNNLHQESTYAAVERQTDSGAWEVVRNDRDWNLLFTWTRTNTVLGYSEVTLQWQIEDDYYSVDDPNPVQSGTYRMHYYGDSKSVLGQISSFEGIGGTFTVKA